MGVSGGVVVVVASASDASGRKTTRQVGPCWQMAALPIGGGGGLPSLPDLVSPSTSTRAGERANGTILCFFGGQSSETARASA